MTSRTNYGAWPRLTVAGLYRADARLLMPVDIRDYLYFRPGSCDVRAVSREDPPGDAAAHNFSICDALPSSMRPGVLHGDDAR